MDAVRIEGLTKAYKDITAVDHLSLTIAQGELFSLLGVNGAGKTTTIKMLCCLTAPSGGDAFLLGHSVMSDAAGVKGIIGVSPQETAVAPGLTARENLDLMCGVHALPKAVREARRAELAQRLGLESVLDRRAGKLSGGWQRRLSIAMALVSHPQILFLDEPTLGLDVRPGRLVGGDSRPQGQGHRDPHHPLHGRGPSPVRPGGHPAGGPAGGGGLPGGAEKAGRYRQL